MTGWLASPTLSFHSSWLANSITIKFISHWTQGRKRTSIFHYHLWENKLFNLLINIHCIPGKGRLFYVSLNISAKCGCILDYYKAFLSSHYPQKSSFHTYQPGWPFWSGGPCKVRSLKLKSSKIPNCMKIYLSQIGMDLNFPYFILMCLPPHWIKVL